jgi:luciferase family oxidoreductase group 1
MIPISIHDRSHLTTETDSRGAFLRTIERARQAERLGYHRFWTAEHHGVPGVAGSAPAVLIAAIGHATSTIRIGAGGMMMPNHQPIVIAEQFATLEALFPERIDLGLGRSLGFVRPVRNALRRETYSPEEMADDIAELASFVLGNSDVVLMPAVQAVPLFVLATGSAAEVAGRAGLPLVIGGPKVTSTDDTGKTAIDRYRDVFRPSRFASDPMVILNVTALAAETAIEAEDLALSEAWAHVNSKIAGAFLPLESPKVIKSKSLTQRQSARMQEIVSGTITGTPDMVATRIDDLVRETDPDEVLISGCFFDHSAALYSDELFAQAFGIN